MNITKKILNCNPYLLTIAFFVIISFGFFFNIGVGLANTNSSFDQTVQYHYHENRQDNLQSNMPVQINSSITSTDQDIYNSIDNDHNGFISSSNIDDRFSKDTSLLANIFATDLMNRIYHSATILEITAGLPQVRNISFSDILNQTLDTYHGIPHDKDLEKRQLAQDIISKNGTADNLFEIFYLMPNGNMYMLEPYSIQETLKENNYAFREYFQESIQTNETYLGNAIITTASSGIREAVVAVPVYSLEDNTTIVGVWAGGIDFGKINHQLQSLNLVNENKRVVYVDANGEKIADSDPRSSNTFESFDSLVSFKNAINGETGTTVESLEDDDSTRAIISYKPVDVFHNTWVVLVMETSLSNQAKVLDND
jgi:hypothetical protein